MEYNTKAKRNGERPLNSYQNQTHKEHTQIQEYRKKKNVLAKKPKKMSGCLKSDEQSQNCCPVGDANRRGEVFTVLHK